MTGVTNFGGDLTAKRLALLTEAVPRARRVAVMFHPDEPVTAIQQRDAVPAAKALGVELHFVPFAGPSRRSFRSSGLPSSSWS